MKNEIRLGNIANDDRLRYWDDLRRPANDRRADCVWLVGIVRL